MNRRDLPFLNCSQIFGCLGDCTHRPPKSCIPSRANTTVKRKRRKRRLMMDFMELMRDTTRFLREAQYLAGGKPVQQKKPTTTTNAGPCVTRTHLVILKILRSLSALSTLIPNDIPGLKKPQTTSKMLPTMTYKQAKELISLAAFGTSPHVKKNKKFLTPQSKQLNEEWK